TFSPTRSAEPRTRTTTRPPSPATVPAAAGTRARGASRAPCGRRSRELRSVRRIMMVGEHGGHVGEHGGHVGEHGRHVGGPHGPEASPMVEVLRPVIARARRRPVRVIAIAAIAAVAFVAARGLKAPSHRATLYFLLAETILTEPGSSPRALRDIREYISNIA